MYPPQIDLIDDIFTLKRAQSLLSQPLKGDLIGRGMDVPIDLVAPSQGLSIQIRQTVVLDSNHEIIPHKLYCPLHLALGLPAVRPAQDRFKPVEPRKVLKLPVQRGVLLFQKPLDDYLLHVVV